jgi:hypothetical protein
LEATVRRQRGDAGRIRTDKVLIRMHNGTYRLRCDNFPLDEPYRSDAIEGLNIEARFFWNTSIQEVVPV